VVICLEQGADLHMAQLMPLPLTVSCFSKIKISFTFLVPAHPGSPGKGAVKRVCVCVCVCVCVSMQSLHFTSRPVASHRAGVTMTSCADNSVRRLKHNSWLVPVCHTRYLGGAARAEQLTNYGPTCYTP